MALNYASQINGFTHINLTKLDVLSGLPTLEIGVAYKLPDGTVTTDFPSDIDTLEKVEMVYESMPGWEEDISDMRTWDELPETCKAYVMKIEELCGVECRYLGVGPGRDARPEPRALVLGALICEASASRVNRAQEVELRRGQLARQDRAAASDEV